MKAAGKKPAKRQTGALARIRIKKATGVVLSDERVIATTVAATLAGPRRVRTVEVSLEERGIGDALRELQAQGALKGAVVVGVPSEDVFYRSGRSVDDDDEADDGLVPSSLASLDQRGGIVRDSVVAKVKGGTFRSVAVCRKRLAEGLLVGLSGLPSSRSTLEPTPLALHRLARSRTKIPRKWKTWVHVLLQKDRGLAILVHRDHPLAWRVLSCTSGGEIYAVVGALMGFLAHTRTELGLPGVDGIVLHGKERAALATRCKEHFEIDTIVAPPVGLDPVSAATGHAMAALKSGEKGINLFRSVRPQRGALHGFPRMTAAAFALIVIGSAYLLWTAAERLERKALATEQRALKSAKVAGTTRKKLKQQDKLLNATLEEAQVFIGSRVLWAPVLRELPGLLPRSTVVVSLLCDNKLPLKDVRTGRRLRKDQVSINFEIPVDRAESFPHEPREIVYALSTSPVLARHFDDFVGGTVTRVRSRVADGPDTASFVVTCRKAFPQP